MPAFQFENPFGNIIKEIAVVCDDDDRSRIVLKLRFKPVNGFGIKVVGWLIEQEEVGAFKEGFAKGDASFSPPLNVPMMRLSSGRQSASLA